MVDRNPKTLHGRRSGWSFGSSVPGSGGQALREREESEDQR